jgi:hypothetical protein
MKIWVLTVGSITLGVFTDEKLAEKVLDVVANDDDDCDLQEFTDAEIALGEHEGELYRKLRGLKTGVDKPVGITLDIPPATHRHGNGWEQAT